MSKNGEYVVWTEHVSCRYTEEIFVWHDGVATQITDGCLTGHIYRSPWINDYGDVVYIANRDGFGIYIDKGIGPIRIAYCEYVYPNPKIFNNGYVMWSDYDDYEGDIELFLWDSARGIIQLSHDDSNDNAGDVSDNGEYIIWNSYGDIFIDNSIDIIQFSSPAGNPEDLMVNNDGHIVFLDSGFLYYYNGIDLWPLQDTYHHIFKPTLNNNGYVVWLDVGSIPNVFLYDGMDVIQFTDTPGDHEGNPKLNDKNQIVWDCYGCIGSSEYVIYLAYPTEDVDPVCPENAMPEASIAIPITITNGEGIDSLGFDLTFNTSILAYSGFDTSGCLLESWVDFNCTEDASVISCEGISGTPLPFESSGCLAELNFNVLPGTGGITTDISISDLRDDLSEMTTSPCSFYIGNCTENPDCDDGLWCNGVETCVGGICQAGTAQCPDDGLFCTGVESCDEDLDQCVSSGDPCVDGSACTDDICDEDLDECENPCIATDPEDPCCDDPSCVGDLICIPTEFTLDLDAFYATGYLVLNYSIGTPEPATWSNYLILVTPTVQVIPLWSVPLPVIQPPYEVPIAFPFPSLGWVGIYTGLFTTEGAQSVELVWVNTG